MIETQDQFEAAFDRVLGYLAHPPQPGSAEDETFAVLLHDLAAYRHAAAEDLGPVHPAAVAFKALDDQIADFRQRHPERVNSGAFSQFGFGRDLKG